MTLVLTIHTGLKQQHILLIHTTSFLLINTLVISLQKHSLEGGRIYHTFGWAKVPTTYGGSKLDPRSVECKFLGYTSGSRNYKVQDITTHQVFILHDVIFEEGQPCHTSASVGEEMVEPVFNMNVQSTLTDTEPNIHHIPDQQTTTEPSIHHIPDQQSHVPVQPSQQSLDHINQHDTSKPR